MKRIGKPAKGKAVALEYVLIEVSTDQPSTEISSRNIRIPKKCSKIGLKRLLSHEFHLSNIKIYLNSIELDKDGMYDFDSNQKIRIESINPEPRPNELESIRTASTGIFYSKKGLALQTSQMIT